MTVALAKPPCQGAQRVTLDGREFWSTGGKVIRFIETFCLLSNGRWTGERFVLLPWQKRLLYELFEVNGITGIRRYRRALIGLPRKAGKTELAAALALYLMLADGERSAAIYCAAASEDQADMVFEAARRMCELDGAPLAELVTVEQSKLTNKVDPYSFLQRLTSKGKTKHGLNIHGVILDELHAWMAGEGDELWAALNTGSAARQQPMQIAITTAGLDLEESRCGQMYLLGRAIERGEQEDGGFFFRWWQAPKGMDYRDPDYPRLASPSYGHTTAEGFYEGELSSVPESVFRRLYGNEWVDYGASPWVTREQAAACRVKAFCHEYQSPTWVGADLSRVKDSSAVVWGQWIEKGPCGHDRCLYVRSKVWERPRKPDGSFDETWKAPTDDIRQFIRDLNTEYRVALNAFDPYEAHMMIVELEAEELPCESLPMHGLKRSSAASAMYELIRDGRFHFQEGDVLESHILNATIKEVGEDGYYLQKRRKGKVMDAAQAASHVVYGTIYEEVAPTMGGFFA